MNSHHLLLVFHIACGVAGLIVGLIAMRARKLPGLHTNAGEAYHWIMFSLCASACVLTLFDWEHLWWFVPIGVGSYGFALLGYVAAKRRWPNWLESHLTGQIGSYIAMCTAVLVVNFGEGTWWTWVLPTAIASPFIAWIKREVKAGRRPKY
jgi:hypothetical protein